MIRKYLLGLSVLVFAFAILSISILESSSVSYSFTSPTPPSSVLGAAIPQVDYQLPFPGGILPDNPLWGVKVLRDKVWYFITSSPLKRAELALLFADKRLVSSRILFENKKPDIAVSTFTKGEKYLEIAANQEKEARAKGFDTSAFLVKLATAALKHREVAEASLSLVPEDGKPVVVKTEDYAKNIYKETRDALNSKGTTPPKDPFDGD
jgi:hypothetical protein